MEIDAEEEHHGEGVERGEQEKIHQYLDQVWVLQYYPCLYPK